MRYLVYTKGKLYLSAPRALVVSEEVLAGTDQHPGVYGGCKGWGGGGGGGRFGFDEPAVGARDSALPLPTAWPTIFSFWGAVRGMSSASIMSFRHWPVPGQGESSLQVQGGVCACGSRYMRSTLSHNFASVAFETVLMFV